MPVGRQGGLWGRLCAPWASGPHAGEMQTAYCVHTQQWPDGAADGFDAGGLLAGGDPTGL